MKPNYSKMDKDEIGARLDFFRRQLRAIEEGEPHPRSIASSALWGETHLMGSQGIPEYKRDTPS